MEPPFLIYLPQRGALDGVCVGGCPVLLHRKALSNRLFPSPPRVSERGGVCRAGGGVWGSCWSPCSLGAEPCAPKLGKGSMPLVLGWETETDMMGPRPPPHCHP